MDAQKEVERQDERPGREHKMQEKPAHQKPEYRGSGKLKGKVILITGGDSGIGRAAAVLCAREGASIALSYLEEHKDAAETKRLVQQEGAKCATFAGDVGKELWCRQLVDNTLDTFDRLDVLVNNASEQHPQENLEDISAQQMEQTFRSNIFSMFYLTKAALPHMDEGGSVINTSSVTAYKGHPQLIDYAATKGAIIAFTRSLALSLAERKIRVNAVAPGPIWTPLIPSTFPPEKVEKFGKDTPLGRPGQPEEVAPAYVFLASDDASYITGQTIHINGGSVING